MASASTSVETGPPLSIFDVSELVELVAQYLSRHDIIQCVATSKTWTRLFEPFLWQDILLKRFEPAPQALALNRHRIRSLHVGCTDLAHLQILAVDLPDINPNNLSPGAPGVSQELGGSTNPQMTENSPFPCLRTIHIHPTYEALSDFNGAKRACINLILRILNQSPGLTRITLPDGFLEQHHDGQDHARDHIQSFLYTLGHKLLCLRRLEVGSSEIEPEIGLDLLRVCFNHPQLVELLCNFQLGRADYPGIFEIQRLDRFLMDLENDKQAKEASEKLTSESRIRFLSLPRVVRGYPPNFLCTLLKSHLPNLERFDIPDISGSGGIAHRNSIKEAVAQGCPKLQHIRPLLDGDDGNTTETVIGIIEGCKEWGLKTFRCDDLVDMLDVNDQRGIIESLLMDHTRTLEEIELARCRNVRRKDFINLFSKCRILKKAKIQPDDTKKADMEFQDIASQAWVCSDLNELQLTLGQHVDLEEMEFSSSEEGSEDEDEANDNENSDIRRLRRFMAWEHRKVTMAYRQIGRLVKLEKLWLGYDPELTTPMDGNPYDLTLERGYLRELAGLKELKHLCISEYFWSRMGRAEVEFMDAQWPKLEKITFRYWNMSDITQRDHWKWLKQRRPSLRYSAW
ncbi:hypothetical protein BGX34_005383 [Mortierella sp. NVP85]|nr:hypothetical protein BGX34_005383 [Mortierella sp. NVP85]